MTFIVIQRGFIFPIHNRYQTRDDVTLYKRAFAV